MAAVTQFGAVGDGAALPGCAASGALDDGVVPAGGLGDHHRLHYHLSLRYADEALFVGRAVDHNSAVARQQPYLRHRFLAFARTV